MALTAPLGDGRNSKFFETDDPRGNPRGGNLVFTGLNCLSDPSDPVRIHVTQRLLDFEGSGQLARRGREAQFILRGGCSGSGRRRLAT